MAAYIVASIDMLVGAITQSGNGGDFALRECAQG